MGKFSASIKSGIKVKNHGAAKNAKLEIRCNVLDAVGRDSHVFDAFAGTGEMFKGIWHEAAGYVGCDQDWVRDTRLAYVCDNRRVLRAIDLHRFSIFDLDAFGSPYEQAIIIAARRHVAFGGVIGIVLTDGSGLKVKQGGLPNAMAELADLTGKVSGLARWQDDLIDRCLAGLCRRMNVEIQRRWQAKGSSGAGVRYIGLVLRGLL